jgi:hypothetical protein
VAKERKDEKGEGRQGCDSDPWTELNLPKLGVDASQHIFNTLHQPPRVRHPAEHSTPLTLTAAFLAVDPIPPAPDVFDSKPIIYAPQPAELPPPPPAADPSSSDARRDSGYAEDVKPNANPLCCGGCQTGGPRAA